jgi:hypothetical protein
MIMISRIVLAVQAKNTSDMFSYATKIGCRMTTVLTLDFLFLSVDEEVTRKLHATWAACTMPVVRVCKPFNLMDELLFHHQLEVTNEVGDHPDPSGVLEPRQSHASALRQGLEEQTAGRQF